MTIDEFLAEAKEIWPAKELNSKQIALYRAKMYRFSGNEIAKLFDYLTENSKFFPKIPDLFEAARFCQIMNKPRDYKPHSWTETSCLLCGGSGQLAVFFEQMFDPANGSRELRLQRIMQYEASEPTTHQKDWTRYYYRCSCPAGGVSTLPTGTPRWSQEQREVRQLSLGG